MTLNWKKTSLAVLDIVLAVYLVLAVTSFNKPDEDGARCIKVAINISDSGSAGFLSASEVKNILDRQHLYPLNRQMRDIDTRKIEEILKVSPFVNTAECYKTKDGHVCINVTQRLPVIRIKNQKGDDYYLDDQGGTLPNSHYTSDLIVATGNISRTFARNYVTPLSKSLMASDFWSNQIEQINVMPDLGIEIVPRVGGHVVFLGYLPQSDSKAGREKEIADFVSTKLTRLEKFYRYGLSNIGWNKYSYISMEFDNQIICKKRANNQ